MELGTASSVSTLPPRLAGAAIIFRNQGETLETFGCRAALTGSIEGDLIASASNVLAAGGHEALVAGALPFDRHASAYLVAPEVSRFDVSRPAGLVCAPAPWQWRAVERPARGGYEAAVREALGRLSASDSQTEEALTKVVLARTVEVFASESIDPSLVLARLLCAGAEDAYSVSLPPTRDGSPRTLVGASPELLIEKRGMAVTSLPMAGSSARRAGARADRDVADALMHSSKDMVEHRFVVESVLDTLAPHCRHLDAPDQPELVSTPTMWHLATPVRGELKREISSLELAAALHPTPAVCGSPRQQARDVIAELEPFDRGFFGGAVGWCDGAGDGRWMVTIRCADIAGSTARLFAGAGIVPGSDPAAEADETGAKFQTMLRALGIDP